MPAVTVGQQRPPNRGSASKDPPPPSSTGGGDPNDLNNNWGKVQKLGPIPNHGGRGSYIPYPGTSTLPPSSAASTCGSVVSNSAEGSEFGCSRYGRSSAILLCFTSLLLSMVRAAVFRREVILLVLKGILRYGLSKFFCLYFLYVEST